MHFHLPKPLHGWREFAGEVGIIVVGVLIALSAEAVVQALHEHRLASDARNAIRTELRADLGELSQRIDTEGCIARRLDELSAFIDRASAREVADPPTWIGRPQIWNMDTFRWDAASEAGRVALLPMQEQSEFSDSYGALKQVAQAEAEEQDLWAELRALEGQHRLSPDTAFAMREVLSKARLADWHIHLSFRQTAKAIEASGMKLFRDPRYPGSPSICLPSHTSRGQALTIIGPAIGEP